MPAPKEPAPKEIASDPSRVSETGAILTSIGELTYEWDLVTDRIRWGDNIAQVLGPLAREDLSTGLAYGARLSPESVTSRYDAVMAAKQPDGGEGASYQVIYALLPSREAGRGSLVWLEDTGRCFIGADGRPARAHGVVRDISERYKKERLLARHSQFDALTNVLTRRHLMDHMQRLIDANERDHKPFVLLLVALENLFALNRNYGYDVGDNLISKLAARLVENVRAGDLVGRHAGNKFAVVFPACDTEQMQAAAHRLIEAVTASPFETPAGAIPVAIRIGGVVAPKDGRVCTQLFQRAEEALDAARQRTGARFVAYSASLAREESRLRALQIADSVVSALNENRVELAFQPIVRAKDCVTAFHEALLRVRLVDGSVVAPGSILPVAEKAGLMRLLDHRVIDLALDSLAERPDLRLSVNVSLTSLLDPEWLDLVSRGVRNRPDIAPRLIVEITETSVIEDIATTGDIISACRSLGLRVAMDDFGSGHTSFRNLRALSFDLVKIDGVFVRNIVNSEDDRFFVRTLIDLAHHLELEIVAEWVEDEETAALLRAWGVDYFQGSLYGNAASR